MPVDDSACQAALDDLIRAVNAKTPQVSRRMAERVRQMALTTTPVATTLYEHGGGRVDVPGLLADSIVIEGPMYRGRAWTSRVGPTAPYARQRELGGPIDPVNVSLLHWIEPGAESPEVFAEHVDQEGSHYFKRAWELALPQLDAIAAGVWTEALAEAT